MNYQGVGKGMSSHEITEQSSKIVNFIDLAGHEKYLKTTMFGLTGKFYILHKSLIRKVTLLTLLC